MSKRKTLKKILGLSILGASLPSIINFDNSVKANVRNNKEVDLIVVWKSKRRLTLFYKKRPINSYNIRLGFNPIGHKNKEGDGKTPEGYYRITHKNPNSLFHKSLGISYPNEKDKMYARKKGIKPGKDIYIHGGPGNFLKHLFFDWTEGCIAVTNHEIEEIYQLVQKNTPIFITS